LTKKRTQKEGKAIKPRGMGYGAKPKRQCNLRDKKGRASSSREGGRPKVTSGVEGESHV